MFWLKRHPSRFAQALQQRDSLFLTKEGAWDKEGLFRRLFCGLIGLNRRKKAVQLIEAFISSLDALEKEAVLFSSSAVVPCPQHVDFQGCLAAAEALAGRFSSFSSKKVQESLFRLKRRVVALRYRLEKENGGWDQNPVADSLLKALESRSVAWKHTQNVFREKTLTEEEKRKLREACHSKEFAQLLLEDAELAKAFLEWALRDGNAVAPFIQFPALQERLVACRLSSRIGRVGGSCLKVQKVPVTSFCEKVVTLPFEGHDVNILNDQAMVTFWGNYSLTLREVFTIFQNKYRAIGNLEMMANGITNWNTHFLGRWNADTVRYELVDMNQPEWWRQLPLFEVLTKEQAQKRYGVSLDGKQWNIAATACRNNLNLDPEKNHAYFEIAIPTEEGHYAIYALGKYGLYFPVSIYQEMYAFAATIKATVVYPDETLFYTFRQRSQYSFPVAAEMGMRVMESIRQDILKARDGNFVYQVESENCAKWIQNILEDALGHQSVPNLFKLRFLETQPTGLPSILFGLLHQLPYRYQDPILLLMHYSLAPWRGVWVQEEGRAVWKSLIYHRFWQTAEVYLPAFLLRQQELGVFSFAYQEISAVAKASTKVAWKFASQFTESVRNVFDDVRRYLFSYLQRLPTQVKEGNRRGPRGDPRLLSQTQRFFWTTKEVFVSR